ncbi:TaqI-like C-terminal specificity domain-containing protein [uncultured Brachyspira sp.]|uniref:TaqI-like C-terminal specificity domain-containing protein n=1 Tax=uncultured Brachyspira sp. TaxID=221953 RepID=UPI002633C61F|nr:TaqI-like C-terminal specificity domain-containing protein [uncultured Brachyspira sp.]
MIRGENISRYIITEGEYYVHPDFKNESKIFKREEIFTKVPKMVTKFVSNNIEFALDEVGYCNTNVVYNVHIIDETHINYLLAVLNSKVVNFWFKNIYVNDDTLFPHIQKNQLESIPIPLLDISDKQDKEMHDEIVNLADNIIKLNKKLAVEKNPNTITMVSRQISAVDKAIDKIVYALYWITYDEIKIIESE